MDGKNKGNLEAVVNCLQRENRITIIGHSIPDGDCVGACLGMGLALEKMGKKVNLVLTDPIPTIYSYLKGQHLLTSTDNLSEGEALLYVDCAGQERTGALPPAFVAGAKVIINIDHHVSNPGFGDYCWVQTEAASACEICLLVLDALGMVPSKEIANAFYTGIIMDTGSFLYSSVTPQTMRAAARLLEYGADKDLIRQALFETKSWTEMQVLQLTLQNLQFSAKRCVGWSTLTREELINIGAQDLHFEGIINYIRNIEGVEVAILFREMADGQIKLGFRSRGKADVNKIAAIWNGGGHRLAAGASISGPMSQAVAMVTQRVDEFLS